MQLKTVKTEVYESYTVTVTHGQLTVNRELSGWNKNTPLRLRLSGADDFVKKSGIKLRFLAKWDEYPDTFIWLIPKEN